MRPVLTAASCLHCCTVFSLLRGTVFSLLRGIVFSLLRGIVFSLLHRVHRRRYARLGKCTAAEAEAWFAARDRVPIIRRSFAIG